MCDDLCMWILILACPARPTHFLREVKWVWTPPIQNYLYQNRSYLTNHGHFFSLNCSGLLWLCFVSLIERVGPKADYFMYIGTAPEFWLVVGLYICIWRKFNLHQFVNLCCLSRQPGLGSGSGRVLCIILSPCFLSESLLQTPVCKSETVPATTGIWLATLLATPT